MRRTQRNDGRGDPGVITRGELSRLRPPSADEIDQLARLDAIELRSGEAAELLPVISTLTDFADVLERLDGELSLPTPAGRDPGHVPSPEDNPFNAFIRRCRVEGSGEGPL